MIKRIFIKSLLALSMGQLLRYSNVDAKPVSNILSELDIIPKTIPEPDRTKWTYLAFTRKQNEIKYYINRHEVDEQHFKYHNNLNTMRSSNTSFQTVPRQVECAPPSDGDFTIELWSPSIGNLNLLDHVK